MHGARSDPESVRPPGPYVRAHPTPTDLGKLGLDVDAGQVARHQHKEGSLAQYAPGLLAAALDEDVNLRCVCWRRRRGSQVAAHGQDKVVKVGQREAERGRLACALQFLLERLDPLLVVLGDEEEARDEEERADRKERRAETVADPLDGSNVWAERRDKVADDDEDGRTGDTDDVVAAAQAVADEKAPQREDQRREPAVDENVAEREQQRRRCAERDDREGHAHADECEEEGPVQHRAPRRLAGDRERDRRGHRKEQIGRILLRRHLEGRRRHQLRQRGGVRRLVGGGDTARLGGRRRHCAPCVRPVLNWVVGAGAPRRQRRQRSTLGSGAF